MMINHKHRHSTEDEEITNDEMQEIVANAITEKIGKGHAMFREQLGSFISEYLKKTNRYYKLPKNCIKHTESVIVLFPPCLGKINISLI